MKKFISTLVFFLSVTVISQVTNQGKPASWSLNEKNKVNYIKLSSIDLNKIVQEDEINDQKQGLPYRVGVPIKINSSIENSGDWTVLDNGDRIWRIAFNSSGAVQMSVNFD